MKTTTVKNLFKLMWLMLAAIVIFVSCKKDDKDDDPLILVEDGYYIEGDVTSYNELDFNGMMIVGINEADDQTTRTSMFEKYLAVKAGGDGFNVVQVAGQDRVTWGPGDVEERDTEGEREQPSITIQTGSLANSGVFTVPEDGLYHIIIDIETNSYVVAPVPYWAIIGGATDLGWSDTEMPMSGGFSLDKLTFMVEDIDLRSGDFKFRYGGGWKLEIDGEEIKVNTNLGGTVSGNLPNLTTTLERGGDNYTLSSDYEGVYTVAIEWTPEDGFVSSLTKTDDLEPLGYPEELYMIGASVGGWDWGAIDLPMVPVHSKPHLFWKIVWIEAGVDDAGYKFAPEKDWGSDFGVSGDATNGIFSKGGDNLPDPGTSGYYMVVVNLETEQIATVDPKVYLIGETIGSWDTAADGALFDVDNDNQVLTITKNLEADELRMYAWFDAADGWFSDWWQSEFMIFDGAIEFRGVGDDQGRISAEAGENTINLNFIDGTGSIE